MKLGGAGWCFLGGVLLAAAAWGEEYVYEGKSAAEWAKELKAGDNVEKAQHALVVLGQDALPALMQLLREPDAKLNWVVLAVLKELKLDQESIPRLLPLLKDESFEVRRAAVRLLGRFAHTDAAAGAALKGALQDQDRAVAEAAEEVLSAKARSEEKDKLATKAAEAAQARTREEAQRAQQLENFLKQARILLDKGEVESAHRILRGTVKLFPGDERAAALLQRAEAQLHAPAGDKPPPPEKEQTQPPAADAAK